MRGCETDFTVNVVHTHHHVCGKPEPRLIRRLHYLSAPNKYERQVCPVQHCKDMLHLVIVNVIYDLFLF